MRVIALDTTTRAGSVALVEDDRVVAQRGGDAARTHALRLPGEIVTLAAEHGWPLDVIDLYAVATGPGLFTGLRIGLATIQGLAFVHARKVVGMPVLEAIAYAASAELPAGAIVGAWMDAHRQDVFTALYRVNAAPPFSRARLTGIEGPAVGSPAATLARWQHLAVGPPAAMAGDGAVLHAADISRALPAASVTPLSALAGVIGLVALDRAAEALEASQVRPLYVRRPDVEIVRDEKLRRERIQAKDTTR